jgi:hypothetical protein
VRDIYKVVEQLMINVYDLVVDVGLLVLGSRLAAADASNDWVADVKIPCKWTYLLLYEQ